MSTPTRARGHVDLPKTQTLIEALPWLARFHGATVVVKYGGNAMTAPVLRRAFAEDIVFLRYVGIRVVVVHGGGPQITARLQAAGVSTEFRGGLRVTTPEVLAVVRSVLVDEVNSEIVAAINEHGDFATGLTGDLDGLLVAERRPAQVDGALVDVGFVGDVVSVNSSILQALLDSGRVPVVASVAAGTDDAGFNVNADTAAAAVAAALQAEKLVVLTDVEGLYADWPASDDIISELRADELEALLPSLSEGMVPKMEACLRAVRGGVARAHVLDGRVAHSLLLEVFTAEGIGTMVTA